MTIGLLLDPICHEGAETAVGRGRAHDRRAGAPTKEAKIFFFQAEDGIRDAQESRGLGDVYKRQAMKASETAIGPGRAHDRRAGAPTGRMTARPTKKQSKNCLLYTSPSPRDS